MIANALARVTTLLTQVHAGLVALALLLLGFAFGACMSRDEGDRPDSPSHEYPYSNPPVAANTNPETRRWTGDIRLLPTVRIGTSSEPLLKVVRVRVNRSGDIFVLDWGALKVKSFASDGTRLRTYGRGRGQGPGELLSPTDFDLGPNGEVWVLDPGQGRVVVFDSVGEPVRTLGVTVPALRMLVFSDASYLLVTLHNLLFSVYDSTGAHRRSFGQLIPRQRSQALVLQGEIAELQNGFLGYGPLNAGYLASFSRMGDLGFYVETVVRSPYPPIEVLPSGASRVDPEFADRISTLGLAANADYILALTTADGTPEAERIVDVYRTADGT